MSKANRVVRSINMDGEQRCVDIFRRPDGTYGFDEFRRDPEDNRGWYSTGQTSLKAFQSAESALQQAQESVSWLAAVLETR
ncbi:hypothetical protein FKG95_08375 [Denitrobaculum tricleocarpae]|uniref:Uncharacterized protein n=1 Tax=Denitrobaculum tricleocarpae TaxID=2591009 RepID=A0A545TYF3_9PROT|nr:hypothetical protein FKG95_08375 [Denitrobaculum tricleocarpae]